MNIRKNSKTVQSVEEKNMGLFGRIKSRFKIKTVDKNAEKIQRQTKVKKVKKTKNGKVRKDTSFTTEIQIKKLFRLKRNNPKLSTCDIGRAVGMSDELVKYYLKKGRAKALADFRKHETNKQTKQERQIKDKERKQRERDLKKLEQLNQKYNGKSFIPTPKKLTEEQAGKNLNQLFKKEKYPTEHQSDPRYFAGSKPPQSVATDEAFQDQKRRNNINRAVVAKKIRLDTELSQEEAKENASKARLREKHQTKPPKIHYDCCPSCNPKSNLSRKEYEKIVRQEAWRRHEYAEKERELLEKEKELDKQKREQEGLSVAEMALKGTQICKKCDERIPYSQATRSFSIYGEYYCGDHEPKM